MRFTVKIKSIIAAGFLLGLPTVFGSATAQSDFGPINGDEKTGKELYFEHACYACHGYNGIGRKNLANDVSGIMVSEDVFIIYLRARASQNPEVPTQSMPNYSEAILSDEDARDLYAYIRTFRDEPPEIDKIPSLRSILESAESQ